LVGKPKGKRPLGRLECRWEDIKMDLKERGCEGAGLVRLVADRDKGEIQ
jgi:hypothetical protein